MERTINRYFFAQLYSVSISNNSTRIKGYAVFLKENSALVRKYNIRIINVIMIISALNEVDEQLDGYTLKLLKMVLKINTTENDSLKTHTMRLPQEMICEKFRSDLYVPVADESFRTHGK